MTETIYRVTVTYNRGVTNRYSPKTFEITTTGFSKEAAEFEIAKLCGRSEGPGLKPMRVLDCVATFLAEIGNDAALHQVPCINDLSSC